MAAKYQQPIMRTQHLHMWSMSNLYPSAQKGRTFLLNPFFLSTFQSAEARVFAPVYTPIHPSAGKGQADGARGDIRGSVTEIQRAVCGILSVPRPALDPGYVH